MLDEGMKRVLARTVAAKFDGMGLLDFKATYPAAWKIFEEIWPITEGNEVTRLKALTHNMYRYCGLHGWNWRGGRGTPVWEKLLKKDSHGVEYDCYSIAAALAELCKLLGSGDGQGERTSPQTFKSLANHHKGSNPGTLKPGRKTAPPPKSSVFHLKPEEDYMIVLPLNHLNGGARLLMPGGEAGSPLCRGHHVWADHRFVVIKQHMYDAMLDIAGVSFGLLQKQFVEWQEMPVKGSYEWYKPDRPGKPYLFMGPFGRTFKDKYEGPVEPKDVLKNSGVRF